MAVDPLSQFSAKSADRILEAMDRISEVLFGLIMALTFASLLKRRLRPWRSLDFLGFPPTCRGKLITQGNRG
jgi:hypothetical protein